MRRIVPLVLPALIASVLAIVACVSPGDARRIERWQMRFVDGAPQIVPVQLLAEVRVKLDLVRPGTSVRRTYRPMEPRFITIHSTQNETGNAYNHALALKNNALHGDSWHFTVQQDVAIQHLPCREQGRHADYDGPGNMTSIGIEMCEHHGNDIGSTIDRTARLAAYLMRAYDIPLSHVVPHYHWPRKGKRPPNKNCPHFLLDGGRPGPTWRWFINRVNFHYSRMLPGEAATLG